MNNNTSRQYGLPQFFIKYTNKNFRYILGNVVWDLTEIYRNSTDKQMDLEIRIKAKPEADHLFDHTYMIYNGKKKILTVSMTENNYGNKEAFHEKTKIAYIFVQGSAILLQQVWDNYLYMGLLEQYVEDCDLLDPVHTIAYVTKWKVSDHP